MMKIRSNLQSVKITKQELIKAVNNEIISEDQSNRLWEYLSSTMFGKNPVTIQDLTILAQRLVNKSDSDMDLGGGSYACIETSNALLTLCFIKKLNINQISTIDVNNTDGAMTYKPFCKQEHP